MIIQGQHTLDSNVADLWRMLQEPDVLARITPGISRVEKIAEDRFKAISAINIGPVSGSFEGGLAIEDKREGESMTLVLDQKSKMGNAEAHIILNLAPTSDGKTLVTYNGKAKVTGTLASMGQRILDGVIKTFTRQVFSELEKVISEKNEGASEASSASHKSGQNQQAPTFIELILTKILSLWKSLFRLTD